MRLALLSCLCAACAFADEPSPNDISQRYRVRDDRVDGRDTFVIKGKGRTDSPYGDVTSWVGKQTWVPLKIEYSDKENKPIKRYRTLKLKSFKERTTAAESVMENLQSGSKTQ